MRFPAAHRLLSWSVPMNKKPITLAIAGTLALAGAGFTVNALAGGYMHGSSHDESKSSEGKCGEGKCGEGKCGIGKMDTDKDGKVSKAEFAAAHDGSDEKFASHDPNGDGFIDADEMKAHHQAKGADKSKMEGKCGEGKCGGSA
jgi:uncharacterized low-complexity protein